MPPGSGAISTLKLDFWLMENPLEKSGQQTSRGVKKMTRAVRKMSLDALALNKKKHNTYRLSENAATAPGILI